jgi:hypothetical protein
MQNDKSFNDWANRSACIDWKGEMEDAIHELRELWPEHNALTDSRFDELCENYHGEDTELQLAALGQEFTACGLFLYSMPTQNDEYLLYPVAIGNADDFESYCKSQQLKIKQLKQPRRKPGQPARRIDLGERIPHESYPLGSHSWLHFTSYLCLKEDSHFTNHGALSHSTNTLFDLRIWPPQEVAFSQDIGCYMAYSEENEIWAAVLSDGKDTENYLAVSRAPLDAASWRKIPFPVNPEKYTSNDPGRKYYNADDLDTLSHLVWAGKDLLIAHHRRVKPGSFDTRTHVWVVKNAAEGGNVVEKIFMTPPCDTEKFSEFSYSVRTGNGSVYMLFAGGIYTWNGEKLNDTGIKSRPGLFPMDAGSFGITGDTETFYEYDLDAGKRYLWETQFKDWSFSNPFKEWVILASRSSRDEQKTAIWNSATGAWYELSQGAFGKNSVRSWFYIEPDTMIFEVSGTANKLCLVNNLSEALKPYRKGEKAAPRKTAAAEKIPGLKSPGGIIGKLFGR